MDWLTKIADMPFALRFIIYLGGVILWTWFILIQPRHLHGQDVNTKNGKVVQKEGIVLDDKKTTKTIIGKRVRTIIGTEAPKDDDENTIIGQDTTLVVHPDDASGKTIIGEKIEVQVGDKINNKKKE